MAESTKENNSNIMDLIPAGIAVFNMNLKTDEVKLLMINDTLAEFVNRGRKNGDCANHEVMTKERLFAVLAKNPYAFAHEKDLAGSIAQIEKMKTSDFAEYTFMSAESYNGEHLWIHFDCKGQKIDEWNKILYFTFSDVTSQKLYEEKIRKQKETLEKMYNITPGWIFTCKCDDSLTMLKSNDGIKKFTGYTRDEFAREKGNRIMTLIPNDKKEAIRNTMSNMDSSFEYMNYELSILRKDKKQNQNHVMVFGDLNDERELILYVTVIDVTEMHKVQNRIKESERRYEFAMNYSDYFIWDYNITERKFIGSKKIRERFGVEVKEDYHFIDKMMRMNLIDEVSANELRIVHKKLREGVREVTCRIEMKDKDDRLKFYKIMYKVITDEGEVPQMAVGVSKDVTEELSLIECVHQLISANSFEASIKSMLRNVLKYYDATRAYICEFDWEKHTVTRTYEECAQGVYSDMENLKNLDYGFLEDRIDAFKQGVTVFTERNRKSIPIFSGERLRGYLGIDSPKENEQEEDFFRNLNYFISVEMEKNDMNYVLEHMGYYDILTNVHNRNYYNMFLGANAKRKLINTGIIFVDMNGLKHINDTLGHTYGDEAIVHLVEIIREHYDEDRIFRISGDEFVIIVENISSDEFEEQVASLRSDMIINKEEIASCGCYWDTGIGDIRQGVYRAEQLMYIEKQRYYEEHTNQVSKRSPRILNTLLSDIEKGRYVVYLQPKAKINNRKVIGAEALIRKIGSDGKVIAPYEFVPLLEQECLISKIDFLVLREVCKTMKRWEEEGRTLIKISVNMSRVTIAESDFIQKILSICDEYQVERKYLEFEITESSETMDSRRLTMIISRLKDAGFGMSLDDMGTEYSCLKMLPIRGIDTVKLDRSFITQINRREGYILIKHIIEMCHDLGQCCIAEGVESDEQRIMLKEMGCDYYQGYLLDKPVAIPVFEKYL